MKTLPLLATWAALLACPCAAGVLHVPGEFPTIQSALDVAVAGDAVEVAPGTYGEKIVFPTSGQTGAPIVLRGTPGSRPILDGTGVPGDNMVLIDTRSHVRIEGFEIVNNLGVSDGSGVRVLGRRRIEIRDNVIHDIRGAHAMGITVYGTDARADRRIWSSTATRSTTASRPGARR